MAPSLVFTGSIEPWRVIDLSSEVSGLVESIPIEEGQALCGGQLVCHLEDSRIRIEIDRRRAIVNSALAEWTRQKSGYRTEEVEEARRQVEANQARYERAIDDWTRQSPLVDLGVSTASQGKGFEAAYQEAEAELRSSGAHLAMLKAGYRQEDIDIAQAKLEMNRAELADATRDLARHTILAPTDCVVVERLKEPGEWVREGDPLARLVVLDPLRVKIEVPQNYLNRISHGLEAAIEVDGLPDKRFHAEVEHIVPRAGAGTRNFPVQMKLDNADGVLQSGLFARVKLSLGEKKPSPVVPRDSILIRGDTLSVLVADPIPAGSAAAGAPPSKQEAGPSGSAPSADSPAKGPGPAAPPAAPQPDAVIREVEVKTGSEVDNWVAVEVLKGGDIKAGDAIVVLGGSRLATGMPVRILPNEESHSTGRNAPEKEGVEASSSAGGTP